MTTPTMLSFPQPQPGFLVTKQLDKAIAECKAKVEKIAEECKAKNRKFRDIEFDFENDRNRCLYGIFTPADEVYDPADVHRVTQIFDDPIFFAKGSANSNDVIQGNLGDCWFLSALATASPAPGLVEKFCVARDEKVGVYGFVFFRDNAWVTVVIDDMLYTNVPKWEELKTSEQALYHNDKETFNKSARKGGKSLYFAKSGKAGETWVPLIEKAYAKLHGNFSYLAGGSLGEALEDLTGGVSTMLQSKDILDVDQFWDEELTRANHDRLFGCAFDGLSTERSGNGSATVQGLFGGHAYSVLRAVQCNGKRFVVVRNPWGQSEWTGKWSDGSKEWTPEWLQYLGELGHQFGDDGQFVMEYSDWLDCFSRIDRTLLLDQTWAMSSQWLQVTCPPSPAAWSYGEVSFKFTLSGPTNTIIVLSQLDGRYFHDLVGKASWSLDFSIVKDGDLKPIADSVYSAHFQRSVNLEANLEAGSYTVCVRLDRLLDSSIESTIPKEMSRRLSRVLTERAKSQSIASNFHLETQKAYIPTTIEQHMQRELEEKKEKEEQKIAAVIAAFTANGKKVTTQTDIESGNASDASHLGQSKKRSQRSRKKRRAQKRSGDRITPAAAAAADDSSEGSKYEVSFGPADSDSESDDPIAVPHDSENSVTVGLKVYTNKDVTCTVEGRLRVGCKDPACPYGCAPPTTVTVPVAAEVEDGSDEEAEA